MDRRQEATPVICVACGEVHPRAEAREYDPLGDRWDREGKEFQYLCKPCHTAECHQPRQGLEEQLVALGDDHPDANSFIAAYYDSLRRSDEPEPD